MRKFVWFDPQTGDRDVLAHEIAFKPHHVVFLDDDGRVVLAEHADDVHELREVLP